MQPLRSISIAETTALLRVAPSLCPASVPSPLRGLHQAVIRGYCMELTDSNQGKTRCLDGEVLPFDSEIWPHHLPGHCLNAMAYQVGKEALVVGDSLLPEITTHPTQGAFYRWTGKILPAEYDQPERIYGLQAYLRSLKSSRPSAGNYRDDHNLWAFLDNDIFPPQGFHPFPRR